MSESAIRVDRLCKTFTRPWSREKVTAIEDVSFSIEAGEVFGFIGANGAGKSTTIKILTGVLQQTSGQAQIFGKPVTDPTSRTGLGYVPENPGVYDFLTPLEILKMGVHMHQLKLDNENRHCLEWLDRFGLAHVASKMVRTFSKGMTQRVALAHALAVKPRLLILDEPLSGLDPVGRREVVDILDDFRRSGGTLFFSSHVLYDVERIADRFGLIDRGELLTVRSPQEVVADQAEMYVLRFRSDNGFVGAQEIRAGLFALDASASELPQAIEQVRAASGLIQDVLPKISLETVFFNTIHADTRLAK
jgi:ABC-2 type transport system ATP-binding protein